jgi:hypothetical protein
MSITGPKSPQLRSGMQQTEGRRRATGAGFSGISGDKMQLSVWFPRRMHYYYAVPCDGLRYHRIPYLF